MGGSLVGFPLLGAIARSGELTDRFAGIQEAGDDLVDAGERFDPVGDDSEDGLRTSTGIGVTGN